MSQGIRVGCHRSRRSFRPGLSPSPGMASHASTASTTPRVRAARHEAAGAGVLPSALDEARMHPRVSQLLALTLTLSCAGTQTEADPERPKQRRSSSPLTLERAPVSREFEPERQACLAGQGLACVALARGLTPSEEGGYVVNTHCTPPLVALEAGTEEDPGPTTSELAWERALQNLDRECSAGSADSCFLLATIEREGEAGEVDNASAERHLGTWTRLQDERCRGGDVQRCYRFARELELTRGAPRDRAHIYYGLACAGWHQRACDLALKPFARTREWPGTSGGSLCTHRDQLCALGAAFDFMKPEETERFSALGGGEPSPMLVKARKGLQRGCKRGRAKDCHALGNLEELGSGGPYDGDGAIEHYKTACSAKRAGACQALGYSLLWSSFDARDTSRARAAFERGCELDPSHGCGELALLLAHGVGITAAPEEARGLYQRACEAGELKYACQRAADP